MDGKNLKNQLKGLLDETLRRKSRLEQFKEEYLHYAAGVGVKPFEFPSESPNVSEVTDGDIILLDPSLVGATRPIEVMVLSTFGSAWADAKHWGGSQPCTAITPVSPLNTPAFSCELLTGNSKVLQVWNTRCVPDKHLTRCWKVGRMDQDTVDDAYDVFEHWQGKKLPSRLRDKVFVPGRFDDLTVNEDYYNKERVAIDDLDL